MPKLPKGMFRRKGRPGWYVRLFRGGRERWQSLGTDFAEACDRARALMAGLQVTPSNPGTVGHAAERWLESYVRTQRSEKGQRLAAQRVRDFIDRFEKLQVDRVDVGDNAFARLCDRGEFCGETCCWDSLYLQ